jgi:hypothetical protein
MNKWFESKNFANYAKTALIQAQKKIDQVLDIKEEDIVGQTTTHNVPSTSSASNIDNLLAPILKSSSASSLASNASSKQKSNETNRNKELDNETDSFFTTFLSPKSSNNNTRNNTRSNSPVVPQKTQNQDENEIKFEDFLNQNLSSNLFLNTNDNNITTSSTTSLKSVSPNSTLTSKVASELLSNLNSSFQSNESEHLSKSKRHTSTSSSKSSKAKNLHKEAQQQSSYPTLDIKDIEKDKWIENYVESSITTSSSSTASTLSISNNSKQPQIHDTNKAAEIEINNDLNKDDSIIFISSDEKEATQYDQNNLVCAELVDSSTNQNSDESTLAVTPNNSNLNNLNETDKIETSTEVLNLNDEKISVDGKSGENDEVQIDNIKNTANNATSMSGDMDFVSKIKVILINRIVNFFNRTFEIQINTKKFQLLSMEKGLNKNIF